MFTIRQRSLIQIAMVAVVAFFLALIFSAGFVAAVGWALVLAIAIGFLIRQNLRISQGVDILREDVPLDLDGPGELLADAVAPRAEVADTTPSEPGTATTTPPASRPARLDAPRGGEPDDLTRINGIGPKLRDMLHDMGFYHFDQIANWSETELRWVDEELEGFKGRASRDNWVAQARALEAERSAT